MAEKNLETMTVGELRQYLTNFPNDMPVAFSYVSGDYWKTQIVGEIKSADYAEAYYNDYHGRFTLTEDEEYETKKILILQTSETENWR